MFIILILRYPPRLTRLKLIKGDNSVSSLLVQLLWTIDNTDINIRVRIMSLCNTENNRIIFSLERSVGVWLNSAGAAERFHCMSLTVKSFPNSVLCKCIQ